MGPPPVISRLSAETSLYLDLLRLAAVTLVFFNHLKRGAFTGGYLRPIGVFGQEGVGVFFLLSGIVIAHSVASRHPSFAAYAVARLSRLWSVVVPAVVLTVVLDGLGNRIDPAIYHLRNLPPVWGWNAASVWQAVRPLLFMNAGYGTEYTVGTNGPFWSLPYEAWYYLAFGMAVLLRGWWRIVGLGVAFGTVGDPIVLLAPTWLAGVLVCTCLGRGRPTLLAWAGWMGSAALAATVLMFKYKIMTRLLLVFPDWLPAEVVIEKYAPVFLAAVNVICFDRISGHFARAAAFIRRPLRAGISCAFSIYLYQAPLMFFMAALAHGVAFWLWRAVIIGGGALVGAVLIAQLTERQRPLLSRAMARSLALVLPKTSRGLYSARP